MEILNCGQKIRDTGYVNLTQPLLMAHGTTDPVTCFDASKELFEKTPSTDKTFRPWENLFHERKWAIFSTSSYRQVFVTNFKNIVLLQFTMNTRKIKLFNHTLTGY